MEFIVVRTYHFTSAFMEYRAAKYDGTKLQIEESATVGLWKIMIQQKHSRCSSRQHFCWQRRLPLPFGAACVAKWLLCA